MYESDTGLVFFSPMVAGDAEFYARFYRRHDIRAALRDDMDTREEFVQAARHVRAGASVLDAGCGPGAFAVHVEHARYTGLDPYAPADADARVLRESLENHCAARPGCYDVVTAFQVIEHVSRPREFAQRLVQMLKPGGLLILCAPLNPSAMTEIPNLVMNAPPHHLTWWNVPAFAALAEALDLDVVALIQLPASTHAGHLLWMRRLSFAGPLDTACAAPYFGDRWAWHLNLAWSYAAGWVANLFLPLPRSAASSDVLLVARKRARFARNLRNMSPECCKHRLA